MNVDGWKRRGRAALLAVLLPAPVHASAAEWRQAKPGWQYDFPRDHHVHRDFKTEWWYFTGNLFSGGRRFGYEVTFFREGVRPAGERDSQASRFLVDDVKFAHFSVTDAAGRKFHFLEKTSRGAFGEAGFGEADEIAWIDSWKLRMTRGGASFHIEADSAECGISLDLKPRKRPAIHGMDGVSAKASDASHASHYYSIPRLTSEGEVRVGAEKFEVHGESWFDHEWATNQLAPEEAGWNWLCVQWDDGSELMLYNMRLENGGIEPSSSGKIIAPDGATTHLASSDFAMQPMREWQSPKSKARYPVRWRVTIPMRGLDFTITPVLENQELYLGPLTYWEGAIDCAGRAGATQLKGRGYLELTGYAGALPGLSR